jgi:hypothetical protein
MTRALPLIAALAAAGALAACDDSRHAESKTPVAEAQVKTDLPPSTVSDQTLQQAADQAAAQASTPAPGTTGTPVTTAPTQ